jgi:hypothetical protein
MQIETKIEIAASPKIVWQILTQYEAHPSWNPFIRSISGDKHEGGKIQVHLGPPGTKGMQFKPRILVWNAHREFRWLGHLLIRGLFDGEHYFIIEENGANHSTLTHGEKFSGILVPLFKQNLLGPTLEGFKQMNIALKMEAEKNLNQ